MSRQRIYALRAYDMVISQKNGGGPDELKFRTLCMKTPSLIQQSGLAQTVVFLRSRDKEMGKIFVDCLEYVLNGHRDQGERLQRRVIGESSLGEYLILTRQAAEAAAWLRRFAQTELEKPKPGDSE